MNIEPIKFERQRREMVRRQIEARGISDNRVLDAFRRVPRHLFVPEALWDQAYGDSGSPPKIPAKADLIFLIELKKIGQ